MTATPDPRPGKRVRLTPSAYRELRRKLLAAHPHCECGCGRRSESLHHVVGGRGREDLRANLMCINGSGTTGCHGALTSKQRVWDALRSVYIDPAEVASGLRETMETRRRDVLAHVIEVKGVDFLDRAYPRNPRKVQEPSARRPLQS